MPTPIDVLVAGGGPAGIAAAVASARANRRTALVERHGVLGGMGTAALVNNFCPAHLDGERLIIGGIFAEVRDRLIARRAIYASADFRYMIEPYDPEVFAEVVMGLCREAGVEVFLGVSIASAEPGSPTSVKLADGRTLSAGLVVDATGDGHLAAACGARFTFGRKKDGAVMPLTYCYEIGGISLEELERGLEHAVATDPASGEKYCSLSSHPVVDGWVARARSEGELTIPRDSIALVLGIPGRPGHATVNFGRVACADPTDPAQLVKAEEEGRRQIDEGVRFFRKYLPGFGSARVVRVARQIGVRESRQIVGRYTLTLEDAVACRQFDDVVTQCCYAIDIHEPDSDKTSMREFARGTHFDIPLRSLIPADGPSNLVVGGRCISATHEAMSSLRVSPSAMAIGEAAGTAAALASAAACRADAVPYTAVRERLLAAGGILA